MKNIIFLFIALFSFVHMADAQLDRSKRPEAGPAPEIKFGEAEEFTLDNGLKVYVIQNNKLPRVTFSLILDRDPILEGDKAGYVGMVGEMLSAGTTNRTKDELNEEIDYIGARLNAGSTSISASTLTKHQEKVMELMADVLFNPLFPQEELDKLKTQAKSGLALAKNDASAVSSMLGDKLVYGADHPYGESETEATIDNITVEDIKSYYNTYFKPNIAYLAIVGDISKSDAEKLVRKHFSSWKKGEVPTANYKMPELPKENFVALSDKSSANQSVISVAHPVKMSMDHKDYLPTRVLNFILGSGGSSRLFMNLREDKGYTYGAYSSFGSDKLVSSFSAGASVGTHVTDSAIAEIFYEINNLIENGVTEAELASAKASLGGSFARSLESPATVASFAINTQRYNLPDDFYTTYLKRISDLTVADINRVAKQYLKPNNMYITVVGNASEIKDKLTQFGEVKMYTNTGEPAKAAQEVDASVTAESIIDSYIKAIGGADKVSAIKTAKIELSASIQGSELNLTLVHDVPSERMYQEITMMGNVVQSMQINDGTANVSAMGQNQVMSEEDYENTKMDMFIFPELHYKKLGYTMMVDGIHDVEGEDAYKVVVTNSLGAKRTNYYSVTNGLKLKSESDQAGDTIYRNYEEVTGVMYPMEQEIISPAIPFPLQNKVQNVNFNIELTEEDFK